MTNLHALPHNCHEFQFRDVPRDLALVRDPAIALTLTEAQIAPLTGSTRQIVELIASLPWVSTNVGVADAALFAFGCPDEFIEYLIWLEASPAGATARPELTPAKLNVGTRTPAVPFSKLRPTKVRWSISE